MRLIIAFLLLIPSAYANDQKLLCSMINGTRLFNELRTAALNDKTKHCVLSCHLTNKCGSLEAWNLGLTKEFLDLLGFGEPDIEDLKANLQGITLAQTRRANTQSECFVECKMIYESSK
jgi:hypothetical protein